MRKIKTSVFRVEDYLETDEDIAGFLSLALEENDPEFFQKALGIAARARGMSDVAQAAGVGRESLYKSLSAEGNPRFSTIVDVLDALGFKLTVQPN